MCLYLHPKYAFGQERRVNLWLRDKSPNINLAVLSALQLVRNWNASLHIIRVINHSVDKNRIEKAVHKFIEDARLPINIKVHIIAVDFFEVIKEEQGDINILGMPPKYEQVLQIIQTSPNSILFVADSGLENALA
ncbi:MAG: solute carrier family 12 (sodium/potassium/chloride transporter), er 2 [Clostridiales bacterium]|nr:solute carrier family 12 (sodium/potassium/chloride transporter), er 2 [Clostridiales bacterium]